MEFEDLSILTSYVDAFNRRDVALARKLFDEHAVFAPLIAYLREPAAPYRGIDDVESFFADLKDLPNQPTLMATQMVEAGDGAIMQSTLRTPGVDGPVDQPLSTIFRFRKGRIVKLQTYGSVETARAALGLA